MRLEKDLEMLLAARRLLHRKGVDDHAMEMVLFAMLSGGLSYSEAVRVWARFGGKLPDAVDRELDEAARGAYHAGARELLNELYREAVVR